MKQSLVWRNKYVAVAAFFVLVLSMTLMGCSGGSGTSGSATGAPAAATTAGTVSGGTISGTVETSTGTPLSGINVYAYLATNSSTGYKQVTANQNYQNAKAMLANQPAYSTQTASNGAYSLSVPQAVYTIVFTDPNGNFTIGTMTNVSVVNGGTQTVNAGMGSSVAVGETTSAEPTVAVSTTFNGASSSVGSSSASVNPLALYSTDEVGYGNTITLVASATSPLANATLSYGWKASYSVNPGGTAKVTASGNTATVTLPTPAQALAGVQDAVFTVDPVTGECDAGMYITNVNPGQTAGCYDVPPYVPEPRVGVLPITADTRGTVGTTVTVTDGLGGSTAVAISSNAAGTQTGLNNVPVGEPVYVNSGKGLYGTASWTLTAPAGSKAAILNSTASIASFVPDMAGTYVATDKSNTATKNTLTVYAGTWYGVITGGGETSATVPTTGFNTFTTPAGGTSKVAVGIWATSAGTYSDWPYVTVNPLCKDCHSSTPYTTPGNNGFTLTAVDKFTPWTGTAHATFMARGMNNITANTGSCLTCHSLGFDQAINAAGEGFSYVAMLDGWAYPATRQAGNWKSLITSSQYAGVAQLSNIQCESCHGPQTSGGHESGMAGSPTVPITGTGTRVSYSAEDCGICHADGTGHHIYSEWLASPNPGTPGSTVTILATSTTAQRVVQVVAGSSGHGHGHYGQASYTTETGSPGHATATDTSCSRCHTAEGFAAYVSQLNQYSTQNLSAGGSVAGVLESYYVPNAVTGGSTAAEGTTVWTNDNAHPQTCTACHDPHNDSNPYQLRVYDSAPITIPGYGVSGLGAGAICVVCHNNRNTIACTNNSFALSGSSCNTNAIPSGLPFKEEDLDPIAPLSNFNTPHDNTQSEVLMGRDAFFMGNSLPMLSKHANIADSCAGCHMTLNPASHLSHGAPATNTHVWYIQDGDRPTLCANCHGGTGDVSGQGIVSGTINGLAQLSSALGASMLAHLPANTTIYVGTTKISTSAVTKISFNNDVTATGLPSNSSTFYFYTGGTTYAASGALNAITYDSANTQPVFNTNGIFKRAVWNSVLIAKDYSNGVHNPSFVTAVLANSISAVQSGFIDATGKTIPW